MAKKATQPVVIDLKPEQAGGGFVTFQDVDQMKIMVLVFAVSALVQAIKILWDWFSAKTNKTDQKLDYLVSAVNRLEEQVGYLKTNHSRLEDEAISREQMVGLVRAELEYLEKIRGKG